MTNDSFAYIPLFLSAVVSLVTIALLFANKKNGSKTTFIMHLVSSVVICVGSVYTALFPGLTIYAASITLAVIIELISSFFKNNKEKQPAEISAELAEAELSERFSTEKSAVSFSKSSTVIPFSGIVLQAETSLPFAITLQAPHLPRPSQVAFISYP